MASLNKYNIKYPTDFILIKKDLLLKFGIEKKKLEKNQFDIFFGENYLFLENNTNNCYKNIIVCSRENFFFTVNITISCLLKKYFEKEVEPHIKNKRGFDYFFDKIGLNINKEKVFRHIIDEDLASDIYIINYKPKQLVKIYEVQTKKEINEIKVNPILKAIIISLYLINPLSEFLRKFGATETDLTSLFINFIHEFPFKYENGMNCIKKIEEIIKIMKIKNNFQDMIDSILDDIHVRLGGEIYNEKKFDKEGNDVKYVCNKFQINFNSQKNSKIKELFYGIILHTTTPTCCQLKFYKCSMIKSIYLNNENIKNFDNLKDIMENWGISKNNDYLCDSCYSNCEAEITKKFVLYPQILIIILNDETGKSKKYIDFQIEFNIKKFSFTYKLLFAVMGDKFDQNFDILKYNEDNKLLSFDPTINSFKKEEINTHSKFPRILFYEKINESELKNGLTQTENNFDNFFNKSITTNKLLNNTRMKKSMEYGYEDSNIMNNEYEIFNIKNKENNNNYNNKNPYEQEYDLKSNNYPDDNSNKEGAQKLLNLNMNMNNNFPFSKEEIEKFGGMENLIKFINSQDNNDIENKDYYDEGSKIGDAFKNNKMKEKLEMIYNLSKTNPNIMNQFNLDNNNMKNNMNNNNFFIQNNFNYYSPNPINTQINYYPNQNNFMNYNNEKESYHSNIINNNNYNNYNAKNVNNNNQYQNSSSNTYTNKENISIKKKKEIKLEFISADQLIKTSLIFYDENMIFRDVIGMLSDRIPEIKNKEFMFLCQGYKININKI